jgi:hypothetical protein
MALKSRLKKAVWLAGGSKLQLGGVAKYRLGSINGETAKYRKRNMYQYQCL